MKYLPLFLAIQVASLVLTIIGIPVIAICLWRGWEIPWLWFNDEDGYYVVWYSAKHPTWSAKRTAFMWLALRNSVANLKHVPGVSGVGRPLFWRTWVWHGTDYYFKAGWLSNGFPCFNGGKGKW